MAQSTDLVELVGLSDHVVRLVVELRLPEVDVPDTLAKTLAHVTLGPLRLVVSLSGIHTGYRKLESRFT